MYICTGTYICIHKASYISVEQPYSVQYGICGRGDCMHVGGVECMCVGGWNKTVCVCERGGIRLCVCVGGVESDCAWEQGLN